MIEVRADGMFYVDSNKIDNKIEITNHEILSFLKEPIYKISESFTIRDFIVLFLKYDNLLAIQPDFLEVIEKEKTYIDFESKEFDKVVMSINSEIKVVNEEEYSKMSLNVQAVCKLSNNFMFSFPAFQLSLRNIINSKVEISPKIHLHINIENNELRTHSPFNISQFTLFDFISTISSMLVINVEEDDEIEEDNFITKREELIKLKERIEREMGISNKEKQIDVEKETKNVIDEINDLLNKKD